MLLLILLILVDAIGRGSANNAAIQCGLAPASIRLLRSIGSQPAVPGSVPWQAAIYKKSKTEDPDAYDFICGGTILAPTLILSAAHCFHNQYSRAQIGASDFKVAVGKYTVTYGRLDYPYTKIIQVKHVYTPESFSVNYSTINSDIAILELENIIDFSDKVLPICIDWSLQDTIPPSIGKVAGWGLTENGTVSDVLRTADLPFVPNDECFSIVQNELFRHLIGSSASDKFCAGTKSGAGVREGDAGGGWTYIVKNQYFIYGVVSFRVYEGSSSISGFTKIFPYLNWMDGIIKMASGTHESGSRTSKTVSSCILPAKLPGRKCSTIGCVSGVEEGVCNTSEGGYASLLCICEDGYEFEFELKEVYCIKNQWIPNPTPPKCIIQQTVESTPAVAEIAIVVKNSTSNNNCKLPEKLPGTTCSISSNTTAVGEELNELSCNCEAGYELESGLKPAFCINGTWLPKTPQCIRVCESLKLDTTLMLDSCKWEDNSISCMNSTKAGITVTVKCQDYYTPEDPSLITQTVTCLSNGTWDNTPKKCTPDCGLASASNRTLRSIGSQPATPGSVPWQVAVYKKSDENPDKYRFICGGTILTPNLILSAANCFYNELSKGQFAASEFKVAIGKYTINYELLDNPYTKIIQVKKVYIPDTYKGEESIYASDIAIVELEDLISISSKIMPICIDWSMRDSNSTPPIIGQVAGWGLTETGDVSDILRIAEIPYIGLTECRSSVQTELFRLALTQMDKFCAGNETGAGVREGDAGGGWTFKKDDRYYIYGVVSFRESGNSSIGAFTRISPYLDWLNEITKKVASITNDDSITKFKTNIII